MNQFGNGARNSDSNTLISCGANALTLPINGIKGEVVVTIKGQQYYLWRAVDAEGNVLDVLLQRHRDTKTAKRFFRKLLKRQGFTPRVIVTDKLKSYEAANKQVLKSVEHRYSQGVEQPLRELPRLRPEYESDACGDSNHRVKPNAFYLHSDRFETTSTRNNINLPHEAIANNSVNNFNIGEKLRLLNSVAESERS